MVQLKGIDASWRQGCPDWCAVKADNTDFAILKSTEGKAYKQTGWFLQEAPKALAAGLHLGSYHFARFSTIPEAIMEAQYFDATLKQAEASGVKFTYPLVCDIEVNDAKVSKKQLTDALIEFLEFLENKGRFAMFYTYDYFLDTQLDETRLSPYAAWIAAYGTPAPKNHADIWQYSDKGTVKGVLGNEDVNYSYRDFAWEIPLRAAGAIGTVTSTVNLNIRDKADISGNIVGQIHPQDGEFKAYDLKSGWYNIGKGWVSGNYVTFRGL